jgi:hypothetical protein
MLTRELPPAPFFYLHSLADLDTIAVDVEHEFEGIRVGRIEESDHINVVLEVGVEGIGNDQIGPQLEELERIDVGDIEYQRIRAAGIGNERHAIIVVGEGVVSQAAGDDVLRPR